MFTKSTVSLEKLFLSEKSLLCIYSWTPWIQNVSTHIDGQDNRKKVASKVKICLISARISPHWYWGLVLSDMICLENSKNVAYLGGWCDKIKLLQLRRCDQRPARWEAGMTRNASSTASSIYLHNTTQKYRTPENSACYHQTSLLNGSIIFNAFKHHRRMFNHGLLLID